MGRPRRFARFEEFESKLPAKMPKRPAYCDGIGIFKGATTTTVFAKIRLPHGGTFRGNSIAAGSSVEIKLGKRSSWDWPSLVAERDRLQRLADRGEPLEAEEVATFATYAHEWLERRKPTLRSYAIDKGNINSALNPMFGRKALNAITVRDINHWIGKQRQRLKPASVQRQLNTFNAIMNDAVRSGVIESNPAQRADRIRGIEARLRFVTEDEWRQILVTADAIEQRQEENKKQTPHQIRGWLRYFLVWAYNSGMRRSEILALTWDNVRRIDDEITVIEVTNTKTGKPRFVTCTEEMVSVLEKLRDLDRAEGDIRLFPLSMTTLKRSLTSLWKATGLKDVRLHDLRRTHATILMSRNIDARTVAGRLGHTGTQMLARAYSVYRGDIEAAQVFGGASNDQGEDAVSGESGAAPSAVRSVDISDQ